MSDTICAFYHREWSERGLADYDDFADMITERAVGEDSFSGYGMWFYAPDEPLPSGEKVIYFGSWGNDNSPGAWMYTHAEVFDVNDPDDAEAYAKRLQEYDDMPEHDDSNGLDDEDWGGAADGD